MASISNTDYAISSYPAPAQDCRPAAEKADEPAAEADPAPTPFMRGVNRRGELIHIKNHILTAGIACAGLHSEDGEAIACVLFDMSRRLDRIVDDQDTELTELGRAERKAVVDDGNGDVEEAAGDAGGEHE